MHLKLGKYYGHPTQYLRLFSFHVLLNCWRLNFDPRIELLLLTFCGHKFQVADSTLSSNFGRGSFSGFCRCMDIYHLTQEIDATDMTALEVVTNVDEEWLKLEKEEPELLAAQVSS